MGEMSSDGMLLSEQRGDFTSYTVNDDSRMKSLEDQIRKQEVSDGLWGLQHFLSFLSTLIIHIVTKKNYSPSKIIKFINHFFFGRLELVSFYLFYITRLTELVC